MNGSWKPGIYDKKNMSPEELVRCTEEKLKTYKEPWDYGIRFWLGRTLAVVTVVFIMLTAALVWFLTVKWIWSL